ncbi:MAG: acyltransferase [Paramuribaculum sp.]|nr:acyltransferase [Paramuribaculum sp.]
MNQSVSNCHRAYRYETIDIAKAFAIILVVIGHFQSAYMPDGYETMRSIIYLFHMPLFLFVSGFLYQATWRKMPYRAFILKKFKRLMIPYFTVSVIIIGLKMISAERLPMENPVSWYSLIEMFYLPSAGFFLWFIWALWWMMVLIPLFKTPKARICLFIVALGLHFCSDDFTDIFCIREFANMLVFFSGGTVVSDYMRRKNIYSFSAVCHLIAIVAFILIATLLTGHYICLSGVGDRILTFAANISGIAMFIAISYYWHTTASSFLLKVTYSIARYSFLIYLLHTTFEGFAKGVLFKIGWFEFHPAMLTAWFGAAIVVTAGVCIPWLLGRFILSRWQSLSFLSGIQYRGN